MFLHFSRLCPFVSNLLTQPEETLHFDKAFLAWDAARLRQSDALWIWKPCSPGAKWSKHFVQIFLTCPDALPICSTAVLWPEAKAVAEAFLFSALTCLRPWREPLPLSDPKYASRHGEPACFLAIFSCLQDQLRDLAKKSGAEIFTRPDHKCNERDWQRAEPCTCLICHAYSVCTC